MDGGWQWWLEGRQQITSNIKVEENMGKNKQRVICKANGDDVGEQKKEENRGSPMNQQSRGLVKKQVRYEENKN